MKIKIISYLGVESITFLTIFSITSAILTGGSPSLLTLPHNLTSLLHPFTAGLNDPQCHYLPGTEGLQPTNCPYAVEISCRAIKTITPTTIRRNKWIWTETEGCAVAYYIPQGRNVRVPKAEECAEIMGGMIEKCAFNSSVNAASENVAVMPDWGDDGVAEVAYEAMYIMAPERLTFWFGRLQVDASGYARPELWPLAPKIDRSCNRTSGVKYHTVRYRIVSYRIITALKSFLGANNYAVSHRSQRDVTAGWIRRTSFELLSRRCIVSEFL